jgi:hypothetical protein
MNSLRDGGPESSSPWLYFCTWSWLTLRGLDISLQIASGIFDLKMTVKKDLFLFQVCMPHSRSDHVPRSYNMD